MQLTRKVLDADGSFGGVVVLSVDCYDLSRFYETLDLQAGSISLVGTDGILRARGPVAADAIGKAVPEGLLQAGLMRERQGTLHATIDADGSPSTVSFRRLQNYKLIVMVALPDEQVLAHYAAMRTRLLAGGAGATVVIFFLGAAWIEQRRRSVRFKRALSLTLENVSQGIVMIDERGRVPVANRRAMELLGLPAGSGGRADPALASRLRSIGAAGEGIAGTAMLRRGDRVIEAHSHRTSFGGAVLTYTDVTDRKRDEARILHLAQHDGLTGLANRMLLNERIAEAARDARTHGAGFAVLTLDLDGFKAVNDGLGHASGDLLLVSVADRLRGAVRAEDTVARVGGDEFTIVLRDVAEPRWAERIAQALVDTLAKPVSIGNGLWVVGASVGMAMYPEDGSDAGTLLKNADIALYRAKEGGRNQYRRYHGNMSEMLEERRWLDRALRLGLERSEFEVHFQPQFGCDTLAVAGFEALVRWRHPERGMISPAAFIPAAEECGLIVPIGRMVLEQACAFAATWRPRCRVAVNLSPVQFRDTGLPEVLGGILRRTGLPADLLELEVTEGVLIRDEAQAHEPPPADCLGGLADSCGGRRVVGWWTMARERHHGADRRASVPRGAGSTIPGGTGRHRGAAPPSDLAAGAGADLRRGRRGAGLRAALGGRTGGALQRLRPEGARRPAAAEWPHRHAADRRCAVRLVRAGTDAARGRRGVERPQGGRLDGAASRLGAGASAARLGSAAADRLVHPGAAAAACAGGDPRGAGDL